MLTLNVYPDLCLTVNSLPQRRKRLIRIRVPSAILVFIELPANGEAFRLPSSVGSGSDDEEPLDFALDPLRH
jgi:hypothetical protein